MSSGTILIVDDEPQIRRVLRTTLSVQGYEVQDARSGEEALDRLREDHFDLLLLDVNMPGMGGLETCREIRATSDVAIVMLTVRSEEADKVAALDAGADDYVTKPFTLDELLARVHAVLRRLRPTAQSLVLGDLTVDFLGYSASRRSGAVVFSHRELEVLHYMAERVGQVVSREELLQRVWGFQNVPSTRCVDNLIARLRLKIEPDPHEPRFLRTAHGDGYRLTPV